MEFTEFTKILKDRCHPKILEESGEVFFGSRESLRNSNGIAIIGLNPGGNGLGPIQESLSNYEGKIKRDDFSGYLDSCWHEPFFSQNKTCERCASSLELNGVVHQDKHQKMVSKIADYAGFDLRKTISTNAIWIQTPTAKGLSSYCRAQGKTTREFFKENFFEAFRAIFQGCGIDFVLCLGNGCEDSSLALFRDALGVPRVEHVGDNYRDGKFFTTKMDGRDITFFGIAHPSMHPTTAIGIDAIKKQVGARKSGSPR